MGESSRFAPVLTRKEVHSALRSFPLSGDAWGLQGSGVPAVRHPAFCPEHFLLLPVERCGPEKDFPPREYLHSLVSGAEAEELEECCRHAVHVSLHSADPSETVMVDLETGQKADEPAPEQALLLDRSWTRILLPLVSPQDADTDFFPAWVLSLPHLLWIMCECHTRLLPLALSVARSSQSGDLPQMPLAVALLLWRVVQCLQGGAQWPLTPALWRSLEDKSAEADLGFGFPPEPSLLAPPLNDHCLGVVCVEPCAIAGGGPTIHIRREFLVFPSFESHFVPWLERGRKGSTADRRIPLFLHECVGEGGGGLDGLVKPFADVEAVFPGGRHQNLDRVERHLARAVSWVCTKYFDLQGFRPVVSVLTGSRPLDDGTVKWSLHVLVSCAYSEDGNEKRTILLPAGTACRCFFLAVQQRWRKRTKDHPLARESLDLAVYERHHMLRAPGSAKWSDHLPSVRVEESANLPAACLAKMQYPLVPWHPRRGKDPDILATVMDPDYWVTAVPLDPEQRLVLADSWASLPEPLRTLCREPGRELNLLRSLLPATLSSDVDSDEVRRILQWMQQYQEQLWERTPTDVRALHHHQCPRVVLRRVIESRVRDPTGRTAIYSLELLGFHACPRMGRLHRSNGVSVRVMRASGAVLLMCLDPDCKGDPSGSGMKQVATLQEGLSE